MRSPEQIEMVLERGRARARLLMTDEVRVTRRDPDAEPTHDEWGHISEPEPLVVYEGAGKFQHSDPYPSMPDAGEARWTTGIRQVHLPYGTTSVRSGDIAECVASKNPRLTGLKVRLRIDGDKTHTTAVRFNSQEVVSRAG